MPTANLSNLDGTRLGQYRIVRSIGIGGMGMVYEAVHETIGYRAAVKMLGSQLARDPKHQSYRDRFLDEARAVNLIDHPSVVRVFAFGETDDRTLYIMMEYLEGQTLASRLIDMANGKQQRLSVAQVMRIGRQVAQAMMRAHARGVVHRDLKPDNLMLVADPETRSGERVKILDFGLALFLDSPERRTTAGVALGTPLYMSPEQCLGSSTDGKTDVYALGTILYEMLAGQTPFSGAGSLLMRKQINEPPPPLEKASPGLKEEVVQLIHRMLEKQAPARPDMKEVVAQIERLLDDRTLPDTPAATAHAEHPVDALAPTERAAAEPHPSTPRAAPAREVRTSFLTRAGLLGLGLLLGCLVSALLFHFGQSSPKACPPATSSSRLPAQPH